MKNFLRRGRHGLLIGIIAVLVLVGAVGAAYTVFNGGAEVTVTECFTVSNTYGDGGESFSGSGPFEWTVSLNPGESKTLNVKISNSSSASLLATLSATENFASIDAVWTPDSGNIAGGGYGVFTLTVTASGGATPGSYTVGLNIARS